MKTKKTAFVILGLLTIKPLSGYDMRRFIQKSIGHFWSESNGQLYPTINALLHDQLIALEAKQQRGKKESLIYAITTKGKEKLKKWLVDTSIEKTAHRDEGLLKLFFGNNISPELSIARLKEREKTIMANLAVYRAVQKEIAERKQSAHATYWQVSLNYGIELEEAELRWCRASIKIIKKDLAACF